MEEFNFGENLRIIRHAKGTSQESMALELNISQTKYSRLERRQHAPDLAFVERISKALKVEPSLLLSGTELEDLVPKNGVEEKAKEIMNTRIGKVFFWMLIIPFINAAYDFAQIVCYEIGVSQHVQTVVRYLAVVAAIISAYYWMKQVQKGKG